MNLEERLIHYHDRLNPTDQTVLHILIEHSEECRNLSMEHIAALCHVSRATLLRVLRKIDIHSFAALKLLFKQENFASDPNDKPYDDVLQAFADLLEQILIKSDFSKAARSILDARTIYIYGTGNEQKSLAAYLKNRLLELGICVLELFDKGEIDFFMSRMQKDDLFILISLSGQSRSLAELALALSNRLTTLSITRQKENRLSYACAHHLYVGTESAFDLEYEMISGFYILIDRLFLSCMEEKNISGSADVEDDQSLRSLLIKAYPSLTSTQRYIAQTIMQDPAKYTNLPIQSFADRFHVSCAALSRFAKKLGFDGYAQLRAFIREPNKSSVPSYDPLSSMGKAIDLQIQEIRTMDLQSFFEHFHESRRVFVVAIESEFSPAATELVRIFLPLGKTMYAYFGPKSLASIAQICGPDDLLIVIANQVESLSDLASVQLRGTETLVICAFDTAPLLASPTIPVYTASYDHMPVFASYFIVSELLYLRYRIFLNEHFFKR